MASLVLAGAAALVGAPGAAAPPPMSPSVEQIIQLVEITSLSASPDGRSVAFRTEQARLDLNTHVLTWHVADLQRGTVRRLGGGGAPLYADPGAIAAEPPVWSLDSSAIFFRALIDDAIGIWRSRVAGGSAERVFRDDADVESISTEGARLRLVLGPTRDAIRATEQAEYDRGVLIDHSVALNQNLIRSGFVNGRLATQRIRGPWFTRVGLLWDAPRRERRLDLATLELGPETAAAPAPALPELGVDPGIAAVSDSGAVARAVWEVGGTRVELVRAAGRAPIRCGTPVCRGRIVGLAWRPGRDQVLLIAQDRHLNQSLHLWSPATGEVRLVTAGDGFLNGGRSGQAPCAVTASAAICVAASAASPPRLERVDLETGVRSVLFDPNPEIRQARMPAVERLDWRTPEGDRFTGILLLPPEGQRHRLPLFLNYYHCGGFLSGGVGDELPFLPLAGAGMAVACINLPPPTAIEDSVGRYEQALRAVRSLVDRLDERGLIDRRRVGMAGLSFGSETTMWTLLHSDLLAAAAIASSLIEPTYYWFNSVRGRNQPDVLRRFWGLGAPDETPEAWRRQSAALNVDRISAPLLMQLPEQEARNVIQLYARLSRTAVPTELYAFPDAAHLKLQPRHRLAAHRRYLDWFRYWLQGYSEPGEEPARAEQYRRWSEMRERWRQARSSLP